MRVLRDVASSLAAAVVVVAGLLAGCHYGYHGLARAVAWSDARFGESWTFTGVLFLALVAVVWLVMLEGDDAE